MGGEGRGRKKKRERKENKNATYTHKLVKRFIFFVKKIKVTFNQVMTEIYTLFDFLKSFVAIC